MHVGDERVAGEALADIETRIRTSRGEAVIELAFAGGARVDTVVTQIVGSQIAATIAGDALPEEAVADVMMGGHVLDDDVIRFDVDPVGEDRLAAGVAPIKFHAHAVLAANRDP